MMRRFTSLFRSAFLPLLWVTVLQSATLPALAIDLTPANATRQADFVLPTKPSKMLRAPIPTWQPLLSQAAAALDERVKLTDGSNKSALIDLHIQRTLLAQTRHDWRQALDALGQARAAQDSAAGRQTSGLLNEVLARRALKKGDKAWVRKHLRDQVLAMPWADVESTIRNFRDQLADVKAETVETYVVNRLDAPASIAKNQVSMGFLFQLLGARFQVLEVMPYRDALVAGLDDAIAQRSKAAPK